MPLIDAGRSVPPFRGVDHRGLPHDLAGLAGRNIILYFYPKDDSTDCTLQACAFQRLLPDLGGLNAEVLGVSPDDERSHQKFAGKHSITFPLLVDARDSTGTPRICDAFGVWQEKSMYGRRYMGVVRTTYLIDADGRVVRRWDKVKVEGHAEEVAGALRALERGEPMPEPAPFDSRPKPVRLRRSSPKRPTTRQNKKAPARSAATKRTKRPKV